MNKCIALSNIDDALDCISLDNTGGLVPNLIFGYWEDVKSFPSIPAITDVAGMDMEVAGKLDGDLVMNAGTKAYTLKFTEDTGVFTIAPQGEVGGQSFLYSLTFISAKVRAKILGFMNAAKNRKMFFIVQDENGTYFLMGDKNRGARLQAGDGVTSGTAVTDRNQTTLLFTFTSPRALSYAGDVENILTEAPTPAS